MAEALDIGGGVSISFVEYEGRRVGLVETHAGADGSACSGYVRFRDVPQAPGHGTGASWVVEWGDPLTLSPSILCRTCGHHGWIRGGKWVPA